MRIVATLLFVLAILTALVIATPKPASGAITTENSWLSKASMQVARSSLGVAVVNGKIYAIGGGTENGAVGTNEEYDPATDTWTFKKPIPTLRTSFSITTLENKIYCIGGYLKNGTITATSEVYDPATDTWETRAPMPTIRRGLKASAANGKIYLIGRVSTTLSFNYTGSLNEVYDPLTDSWTTKAPAPQLTADCASAVIDNYIFVIGGFKNQVYNSETDIWTVGAPPLYLIAGAAVATTGVNAPKRIYVLTEDFYSLENPRPIRLHVYDPRLEAWTEGTSLPTWRMFPIFAAVGDLLYVLGGSSQATNSTVPFDWSSYYTVYYATNEQYTPFGYGTPDSSPVIVPDRTAPKIAVASPENISYPNSNVSLTFSVNEPATEIAYSLDGAANVTITGNTTLTGLANGNHSITVYATDEAGNTGASETLFFSVNVLEPEPETEPFPTVPVVVVASVTIVAAAAGLLLYLRKRRRGGQT